MDQHIEEGIRGNGHAVKEEFVPVRNSTRPG